MLDADEQYEYDSDTYKRYHNACNELNDLRERLSEAAYAYATWLLGQDSEILLSETKEASVYLAHSDRYYPDIDIDLGHIQLNAWMWQEDYYMIVPAMWFEDREGHERYIRNRIAHIKAEDAARAEKKKTDAAVVELATYRKLKKKYEGVEV